MTIFKFLGNGLRVSSAVLFVCLLQACTQTSQNVVVKNGKPKPGPVAKSPAVNASSEATKWQKAWQDQLDRLEAARKERLARLQKDKAPEKKSVVRKSTPAPVISGRSRYDALIAKYARANGVPIRLAHAVVFLESSYRANARGGVGEIGLMQLRLSTARGMGYRGSAKGLYNPETNLKYGMKYLGKAYKLGGGSTCGAILRYNAGHGATRMNPTSRKYCNRVRRLI